MIFDNPGGRPRKYATDADRQAAYRARYVQFPIRMDVETAQTLERISAETGIPRGELSLQMVKFALLNRDWIKDARFTRFLTDQSRDDRRRSTKYQSKEDDYEE